MMHNKLILISAFLVLLTMAASSFEGGSGRESDPYQIATCQQFQDMSTDTSAYYELAQDIDCSETKDWNLGSGFNPVGSFDGELNGNNHTVRSLYMDRTTQGDLGIFTSIDSAGSIQNIGFENAEIKGSASGFSGVISILKGSASDIYVTGRISVESQGSGTLIGENQGDLDNAYSTMQLEGEERYTVGGLIGLNDGRVNQVYYSGRITNSGSDVGGLVGSAVTNVRDGYWDVNQSGIQTSDAGTGLTTTEMIETAGSNMNFDFVGPDNLWTTNDFYYPKLEWQENGINGDTDDPYMIENCHQLQFMNQSMTSSYQLANNIDCSLTEEWNNGKGFDPVGKSSNRFYGNLNGVGHIIHDLTINRPSTSEEVGLFGYLESTGDTNRIRKLGMENVDITGETDVGAIIGQNDHNIETVRKSYVTGNISGNTPVGALIGTNFGQVIDSYAHADVSGYSVGGLIGDDYVDPLLRTYFTGSSTGRPVTDYEDTSNGVNATDTYWDVDTTGIYTNPDNHGAEPLRNYEITDRRAVEYMEGFNFSDTWVARDNDRYPELAVFTNESGFDPGVDQPPGLPTLLNPSNNSETVSIDPNLTAELYHPQGESMTVDFVREDGSSIDSDSGNSLDSVYSVWNSRESGTNYNWSLIIEDSSGQSLNVSEWINDWSFTTIYAPERPVNPDPVDGEFGHPVESNLSAFVSQDDGEQIFNDLYFTNDSSDSRNEFDLESSDSVSGSGDADYDPESFYSGLENGTQYFWYVNSSLTDTKGNTLWNSSSTWNFTTYETPEPDQVMPSDGVTGIDPQPELNVSVDHPSNLTVDFYDYQSHTQLGSARIEDGNWANISTDSFNEYSKSQPHYWYVDIETDNGETWSNNDSAEAYSFTVSNVENVNFEVMTQDGENLDPGTADIGEEELEVEVSTPNDVKMEEIAFNISNSTDYEVTGNSYDVDSGSTVTANISQASIVQEDNEYDWNVFYREGSNVLFESSDYTFSTYVAALSWVPTAGNYDGGTREEIKVYYNESNTVFDNFSEAGSIDYGKINDTDSLRVANSQIDSGDQACYNLTVVNLVGESGPEGDCIGGVP